MATSLAKGVHLHTIPTTKYKTIQISIKFKTPLKETIATKRTLIANLLEISSKKYPNQTALRSKLSELYGAGYGINVSKKGNFHILSFNMSVVNDKYIHSESDLLEEAVDFLKEIIFYPNVLDGAFDETTFIREKDKLADDYDSLFDDKQAYAHVSLDRLLFEEKEQQVPSSGTKEELLPITKESLFSDYQALIANDEIDVYVLGDIAEEKVVAAFQKLPFTNREVQGGEVFHQTPPVQDLIQETETQEITQAKYNLGFTTPIFYHGKNYYAGQVFNGVFGGYPHSKLFLNVREKESLAYYASSSLDTFRGTMVVQTGIDSKEVNKVNEIIAKQLKDMQQGDFSQEAFEQTKSMLKNSVVQSEDNPNAVIERIYANQLALGKVIDMEQWIASIDAVTKEDVVKIAQQIQPKATFFLSGGIV